MISSLSIAEQADAWEEKKPDWRPRKEAYIAKLPAKHPSSLLVSLGDKTHNARAILNDYRTLGDDLWGRFNGGRDGTFWYYETLAAFYANAFPCSLADELARTVAAFAGEENEQ